MAKPALVPLLEGFESFPWGIWALYPHRRHLSPRVRAFIDHMAAELSSADQPL